MFPIYLSSRVWAAITDRLPNADPSDMVRAFISKTRGQDLQTLRGIIRSQVKNIFGKNRGSYPPNMVREQAERVVDLQIETWLRDIRERMDKQLKEEPEGKTTDVAKNFDAAETDSQLAESVASELAASTSEVENGLDKDTLLTSDEIGELEAREIELPRTDNATITEERGRKRSQSTSGARSNLGDSAGLVITTNKPASSDQRKSKIDKSDDERRRPINRASKEADLIRQSLFRTELEDRGVEDAHRERLREAQQAIRDLVDPSFKIDFNTSQSKTSHYQNLLGITYTRPNGGTVEVIQAQDFGNAVQYFKDGNKPRYSTTCGIVCLVNTQEANICGGTARVFVSDAMLHRAASRNWSACSEDVKTGFFTQLGEGNYPRMQTIGISSDTRLQRVVLDYILGGNEVPQLTDLPFRMDDCKYSVEGGITTQAKLRVKQDMGDQVRAYQIAGDQMDGYLFDKSVENLNLMALKRLTSKFSLANWQQRVEPDWLKNLNGEEHLELHANLFTDYATQHCRQAGLTANETKQWTDRATFLDSLMLEGNEDQILQILTDGLNHLRCFIKDELYDKPTTTLRLIVSPPLDVKLIFGAIFKPIEVELYSNSIAGKINPLFGHHFKHSTFDEVSAQLESIPLGEDQVFFETDYSAYESSQGVESLTLEYSIYTTFYKKNTFPHKVITAVAAANMQPMTKLVNKNFTVEIPPMRWSGMPNTACGNLLMNFINLTTVCKLSPTQIFYCEGDDTIGVIHKDWADVLTKRSAFPVTIDVADRYSDLHFCGHHGERGCECPANEQLAYAKLLTYFSTEPLSLQKQYELLYLRSFSYQLLYPQWAGIKVVLGLAATKFMGRVSPKISQQTYRTWTKNNWWWLKTKFGDDAVTGVKLSYATLPQPKGYLFPVFADAGLSPGDVMNSEPAFVEAEVIRHNAGIGAISFGSRLEACLSKLATTLNAVGAPVSEVLGAVGMKKLAGLTHTLGGALTAVLNHAATSVGRVNLRPFFQKRCENKPPDPVEAETQPQLIDEVNEQNDVQLGDGYRPPHWPDDVRNKSQSHDKILYVRNLASGAVNGAKLVKERVADSVTRCRQRAGLGASILAGCARSAIHNGVNQTRQAHHKIKGLTNQAIQSTRDRLREMTDEASHRVGAAKESLENGLEQLVDSLVTELRTLIYKIIDSWVSPQANILL